MTPGAPSPGGYNPHTPGSNIEQGGSDWVTTDILVRVKDSFMDLMGQTGVIRSITVTNQYLDGAAVCENGQRLQGTRFLWRRVLQ